MRFDFLPRPCTPERTDGPTDVSQALAAAVSKRDSARLTFEEICLRHGMDPSRVLAEEDEQGTDDGGCHAPAPPPGP